MVREFKFEVGPVAEQLDRILQIELAGVIYYTHYSFIVYGHARIPITSWLRENATESLTHAQEAGEMIMRLHKRPSLGIAALPIDDRGKHADREIKRAAAKVADQIERRRRRSTLAADRVQRTGERDVVQIMAGGVRQRPFLAPAGDKTEHQARIARKADVGAEAETFHHLRFAGAMHPWIAVATVTDRFPQGLTGCCRRELCHQHRHQRHKPRAR